MREVGDYKWVKIGEWYRPKRCIEKYIDIPHIREVFYTVVYYLTEVYEVIDENHWRVRTVESEKGVPQDILNWKGVSYSVKRGE